MNRNPFKSKLVPPEKPLPPEQSHDWGVKKWKSRNGQISVTPEFVAEVRRLGGLGLTLTQIHQFFGLTYDVWLGKCKKYPEIEINMLEGKAEKIGIASGKLWEHIEKGNLSAIIFFLKTQARWRETDNITIPEGEGGKGAFPPITLTVNDPVEAAKIYQQIMIGS